MNAVETVPKPPARKPTLLRWIAARFSGGAVSLLVHGGFMLLAFLSVAAPRTGRGGGIAGRPDAGSGPRDFAASLQHDETVDLSKSPDARVFAPAEPEPPEAPDAVPPPPNEDFFREQADTGIPVPKVPPATEQPPVRSRDAYSKLPPSSSGDSPDPAATGKSDGPKGNSPVNGTGGDTGGAGDGTVGALFMPAPDYPFSARRRNIEGIVVVEVEVHPDGHCGAAILASSSGFDMLDDAALAAIKKWRYEPRLGEPMVLRRVRFVFKLNKS